MQKSFKEYYPLTPREKQKIWNEAVFVFDANVLLDLYRYSEDTRKNFLDTIEKMKDQIWIPHQFAFEYQRKRLEVIDGQTSAYGVTAQILQKGYDSICNNITSRHPFLKRDDLLEGITTAVQTAISEIGKVKEKHPDWFSNDPIRKRLDRLFKGKVGDPIENIAEIEKQGDLRYQNKIPPGFKDIIKDKKDPTGKRKYGDWIGWWQIMQMAEKIKKPVIFITSETKEDWWLIVGGKTVSPRPELIKEITKHCGIFHMYNMETFLTHSDPHIKKSTIKEIQEISRKIRQEEGNGSTTPPDGSINSGVEKGTESTMGSAPSEQTEG